MMHFLFQRCQLLLKRLWKGTTISHEMRCKLTLPCRCKKFYLWRKKKWNKLTQSHRALMLPLPMLPLLITSLFFIHDYYYFTCILAFLSKCANVTLDLCHFLCFIASLIITVAIFLLIRMINMVEILHFKSEVRCADVKVVYDLLYCV